MTGAGAPPFDLRTLRDSFATLTSGTRMPVLGLGVFQTPPGAVTRRAVEAALEVGYRHIDTARLYRNEADVGAAVRASNVPREALFVTTKLWNDEHGFDAALAGFDRSLSTLGLDYVDLYLIHWPATTLRAETWRALERIHRDGRARAIGVSNFTIRHIEELLARAEIVPAVNQVEFHPFLFQRELLAYCQAHGIQLEAYSPLTRGRRLDDPTLGRIAAAHDVDVARVMIRWGLQHRIVEIPKSVDPGRIRSNAGVFDLTLSAAEMATIDGLDAGSRITTDPATMP